MKTPVGVPARPRPLVALASIALASVLLSACTNSASPGPTATPGSSPASTPGGSPSPTSSPATGEIDHLTGATDVVFRFAEGGGFVPMGFFATEGPIFSLYGDGTVIFKDGTDVPPADQDGISRVAPYKTVKLTEDQVQAFLQYAVADGGIGVARANYDGAGADLPTSIFTINAANQTKTVSVMALGMDRGDNADALVLQALAGLGDKIRTFAREVDGEVTWVPNRWRGVLTPDAMNPPRAWPWPDIAPADFVQRAEVDAPQFPIRTMTPAEADLLGLENIDGGFSGLSLTGPDGKVYFFALRPLLPDEKY